MVTALKEFKINIFRGFSIFIMPGIFTISTTLVSCSVETPKSENKTTGFTAKIVHMGYQSSGDLVRLKGVLEKRLQPLGVTVDWAQFAASEQYAEITPKTISQR
ncbi:MAG: hypothetical protein KAF91_30815 [Nostoc sp. TH1S01]|nr:hypothetical protein [Nostoc sp. TH1S01]